MRTSEQINDLVAALVQAHAAFKPVVRNAKGQVGQNREYKYANLEGLIDATFPALLSHGIVPSQAVDAETSSLVTRLMHTSGQWIESAYPLGKFDRPQDFGSQLSYARRYSLLALLGVAQEDDDGASAQEAKAKPRVEKAPQKPVEPTAQQIADELSRVATAAPLYVLGVEPHEKAGDVQWYALKLSDTRTVYTKDGTVADLACEFRDENVPVSLTTKTSRKGASIVEHFASAIPHTPASTVASQDAIPF